MNKVLLILLVLLISCGEKNEPPKGYIEECYGGNWKSMAGLTPSYSVVLGIEKNDWPKLISVFQAYSVTHGLKYFDSSRESKELSMLYISACSKNGLWLHADKRIWSLEGQKEHSPLPLMVTMFIYSNFQEWKNAQADIDKRLKMEWPNSVKSEHGYTATLKDSLL